MPESIKPKKRLGQNFLTDPNIAQKIVLSLDAPPEAHVVEIGPGMGALTGRLLERFAHVTAIEVDPRAVDYLQAQFPVLDVRSGDILDVDWSELEAQKGGPMYVIGNLPYYLTSQILFSLVDGRRHIRQSVVMMQLEVAERLVASPHTKEYGILSVFIQLYTSPELLFRVSRNVFYPKPDVTSAVVRLTFHDDEKWLADTDPSLLRQVIKAAFNQRRKTLRNSLSQWTRDRGISLPHEWEGCRAEELTPRDFVELAQYLGSQV